jgi:hypothetical protein
MKKKLKSKISDQTPFKIGADPQPWAVIDEKLWSEIEFDVPLTSVADPGCLYPGSRVDKIPETETNLSRKIFIPDAGFGVKEALEQEHCH